MALKSHLELKISLISGLAALLASLLQNLWLAPSGTTLVFDSGHYLGTTQLLCHYFISSLHLSNPLVTGFSPAEAKKLADYLLLDGPLVPLTGAIFFAAHNTVPQAGHAHVFIIIESFFHALAAAMLASLIYKTCRQKFIALAGGLGWAFYPAALLGCDSYLGEVPATALTLLFMRLLAAVVQTYNDDSGEKHKSSTNVIINLFLAASTAAVVFMSKPALVFALLATTLLAWLYCCSKRQSPSTAAWLLAFTAGGLIMLAPWLAFTKSTTGKWHLSAYRIPVYNIARGSSYDAEGWGTVPLDPTMQSFGENQSALACLLTIWRDKPLQSINLALRKPERMWLQPWNDYHHKCFGAPSSLQIIAQQLLLALAAAGLIMLPLALPKLNSTGQMIAISAPLMVLAHCAYVPFESSSRYGFSAAPMFFLLAAVAIFHCRQSGRLLSLILFFALVFVLILLNRLDWFSFIHTYISNAGWAAFADLGLRAALIIALIYLARLLAVNNVRRVALVAGSNIFSLSLALAVAAIAFAHLTYEREQRTWRCKLTPGQSIERAVEYRPRASEDETVMLVVECDWSNSELTDNLEINGKALTGPLFDPAALIKCWSKLDAMQNEFASLFLRSPGSLRQYKAVMLPKDALKDGNNVITIKSREKPVTIYGYTNRIDGQPPFLPAFDYLSAGKLLNEQENTDGRVVTATFVAAPSTCTLLSVDGQVEKDDLSPAPGRQSGTYSAFIVSCNQDFFNRTFLNQAARAKAY
jgi:hypothetical protein